jgi:uncharacterized protein
MYPKPSDLFGRDHEWSALSSFVTSQRKGTRLATVAGRRRQGKTLLLESLVQATDGFYWQAREQSSTQNLVSFNVALGRWSHAAGPLGFTSWENAVDGFVDLLSRASPSPSVAVIDEVGYLLGVEPGVASHLQAALSPGGKGRRLGSGRLILCGSAFGQMRRLVDADAPLRGRNDLELIVRPFGYREAADFWELGSNPLAAFHLHALVGGTPAYLDYAGESPGSDVDGWAKRHLFDPGSPLFRDGRVVIAEDPALGDQSLYWGVLAAIVGGATGRAEIARTLGRAPTSIAHAVSTVVEAGWVRAERDPLRKVASRYLIDEPIVRFHHLVIEPNEARLLRRRAADDVWLDALPTIRSQIYSRHLEDLAKDWIVTFASTDTVGGTVANVGSSTIRVGRQNVQIDLVVETSTSRGGRAVIAIGEVKSSPSPVGVDVLERLDRIEKSLAIDRSLKKLIVAAGGFTGDLARTVRRRSDVELVDLHRLYSGD